MIAGRMLDQTVSIHKVVDDSGLDSLGRFSSSIFLSSAACNFASKEHRRMWEREVKLEMGRVKGERVKDG